MCSSSKNNRSMLTCLLAIIHWYCFYVSMQAERAKLESKELIEDAKLRRQVTPMLYFCNKLLAWHFSWPEGSADQPSRSFGCCTKQIIGNQQDFVAINWQNYCLWLVQPEFRPICWVFPHFCPCEKYECLYLSSSFVTRIKCLWTSNLDSQLVQFLKL
jgi:hypothetical protein